MPPKHTLYLTLTTHLAPLWQQDKQLMEADPAAWHLSRQIDDWLVNFMTDDRVSVVQYERNINRLLALYMDQPADVQMEATP